MYWYIKTVYYGIEIENGRVDGIATLFVWLGEHFSYIGLCRHHGQVETIWSSALGQGHTTYWSTNTFAPSVAICIARSVCHRWRAAICIGQPAICIDCTNMQPSSIRFTIHTEIHIVLSKVCIVYYSVCFHVMASEGENNNNNNMN